MPLSKKNKILKSFGEASTALANYLRDGERLDADERTYVENHVLIVQLAYTTWKHIHHKKERRESDQPLRSETDS